MPKIGEIHDRLDASQYKEVPDQFKALYVEEDGAYVYKDPKALRDTMVNVKGEKATLAQRVQEFETKFAGVDPEEYRTLKSKAKDFENIDQIKQGELDKIKGDLEAKWGGQVSERDKKIIDRDARYANRVLTDDVSRALAKAGVSDKGLELLSGSIKGSINVKMNGDGEPEFRVLDKEGKQRLNDDADPFSVEDLVAEAKKAFPELFNSSSGSGAGTGQGDKNVAAPTDVANILAWSEPQKKAFISKEGHDKYRKAFIDATERKRESDRQDQHKKRA